MTEEKKQPSKEIKAESNNKNIFLFIVLILISGTAAFYLINNKPAEKKQIFDYSALFAFCKYLRIQTPIL